LPCIVHHDIIPYKLDFSFVVVLYCSWFFSAFLEPLGFFAGRSFFDLWLNLIALALATASALKSLR